MSQDLYSVEQIAALLGLHVKTVRNYVRDGRLKAVRIGKQYRIARADLEALTGQSAASLAGPPVGRHRHVEVASVVDIEAVDPATASRISIFITAAAKGRPEGDPPLRIETVYDPERARLKVIIAGGLETTRVLLGAIHTLAESKP